MAAAIECFKRAIDLDPANALDYQYNLACTAALAGTGQAKDIARDDTGKAELRYTALCWLQEHLGACARQFASNEPGTAEQVRQTLLHWQKDADFAAVRDPASLRKLPKAEQVAWLSLWAQVDTLLARTRPGK